MVPIQSGGGIVEIFEFINIIGDVFKTQIPPDSGSNRMSDKLIYQTVLTWFTSFKSMDVEKANAALIKSQPFANKILNGTKEMPITDAAYLKGNVTSELFQEVIDNALLDELAINALINRFKEKGETITEDNLAEDITNILFKLLEKRAAKNRKKGSIRNATFIGDNKVQIGNKIYNLPDPLTVPNLPEEKESVYVNALLEVYSQKEHSVINSMDDLESYPIYKENLQLHREAFYSAESVLYQIRDFFNDSTREFNDMKDEIFNGIKYALSLPHKNGFERVNHAMELVLVISFRKSYLSISGNGLIGFDEEKGMLHMLVNEGKITWIRGCDDENI
ncbi:MAG: ABC-three component system protein [Bacteroidaceae bacterium]